MKTQLKLEDMRRTSVVLQLLCPVQNHLSQSSLVECVPNSKIHENNSAGLGIDGINGKSSIDSVDSLHEGVDLSFIYDSGNETTDNVKMGDSNCSGIRKLFEVSDNADLIARDVSSRFSMEYDGRATFIQCTSLCFNRRRLRGSLIVYQQNVSPRWRLGIVASFNYNLNGNNDDKVTVYEWIGDVSADGSPEMFQCATWDELSVHLKHVTLCIDNVNAYFVNQVSPISINCIKYI